MNPKTGGYGYSYASKSTSTVASNPTFNVTVKKSRLKVFKDDYKKNNVFLEDGEEFEIELFNPKPVRISAQISINGVYDGEVVLQPGQRVFIERFLSKDRKLTFETYEVEGEAAGATVANGVVVVEFFNEKEIVPPPKPYFNPAGTSTWRWVWEQSPVYPYRWDWTLQPYYQPTFTIFTGGSGTVTLDNCYCSTTSSSNNVTTTTNAANSTDTVNAYYCNAEPRLGENSLYLGEFVMEDSFETGRIEGGDKSYQDFNAVMFDTGYKFHTDTVKIWPISHMPADIKKKKKCGSCNSKIRHTDVYCSCCGNKL